LSSGIKIGEARAAYATSGSIHVQEDTSRKTPKWAFLGGGSVPSCFDEDDPTVTAVVATMTRDHDGTYEILNK
jgi:hypothetical protein